MISFRKSAGQDDDSPLTWRNYKDKGRIAPCSPVIVCPNGHYLSIHRHRIADDGTVSPSVGCPIEGCGFQDYIKLEGWK